MNLVHKYYSSHDFVFNAVFVLFFTCFSFPTEKIFHKYILVILSRPGLQDPYYMPLVSLSSESKQCYLSTCKSHSSYNGQVYTQPQKLPCFSEFSGNLQIEHSINLHEASLICTLKMGV